MYEQNSKNDDGQDYSSWWANYQAQTPQEVSEEILYEESFFDRHKKLLVIGIIAAVVLLLAGGGVAYALLSQQPPEQEQLEEQVAEDSNSIQSEVSLYVTAEGANEKSGAAKVVISLLDDENASEKNNSTGASSDATAEYTAEAEGQTDSSADSNGNVTVSDDKQADISAIEGTVIQECEVTPNQTISLGKLDPGSYRLTVVSVPVNEDGSTYQIPRNTTDFTVSGDGKVVSVFVFLPKVVDGQVQEPTEEELATAQEQATGSLVTSDNEVAVNSNSGSSSTGSNSQSHTHNWVAQTTTVHHDAVYRTVHHEAVKQRITVCSICGQDITNNYTAHKNATGHTGYRYDTKVIRDAYDERVLVSGAYDETVITGYKCSECGATK